MIADTEILLQPTGYVKRFRSGACVRLRIGRGIFRPVKGRFITVEGLDGSGKSTQLRYVARWLAEREIEHRVTQEPGGTPLGESIRSIFLDLSDEWSTVDGTVEALMIFASRRQHLLEVIEPTLAAGTHVLCDRFTDSTLAYQGFGRGVALSTLHRIDELATGGRVPDLTLLFDLPAEQARQRGHAAGRRNQRGGVDRLDAEDLDFYHRVREGFLHVARGAPERVRIVDSSGSVGATREQVEAILSEVFA